MNPETSRLRLVPFAPGHILTLMEQPGRFAEAFGARAAYGLREFFASDDVSFSWLDSLRVPAAADPWTYGFALVDRASAQAIGTAGFKGPPDSAGVVEIACGIVPGLQGRGYATEAAAALVTFASADGRVRAIRAHTLPTRNASTRVLDKCGFEFAGEVVDPEDGPV